MCHPQIVLRTAWGASAFLAPEVNAWVRPLRRSTDLRPVSIGLRFVCKEARLVGWAARPPGERSYDEGMPRNQFKLLVDVVVLVAAFLTFVSGMFLFFDFHVGKGAFRTSAVGLTRLTWLNIHRLSALIVVAGIGFHVALNWKGFVARLRRSFSRERKSRVAWEAAELCSARTIAGRFGNPPRVSQSMVSELILYLTFGTVAMTGIVVWLFAKGSAPLAGPVSLGQLHPIRHQLVDIHNIAGLVALALTAHHVGHRWRAMVRGLRSWARQSPVKGADRVASRPETSPGVS